MELLDIAEASIRFAQREEELCRFTVMAAHIDLQEAETLGSKIEIRSAKRTLLAAHRQHKAAANKLAFELRN